MMRREMMILSMIVFGLFACDNDDDTANLPDLPVDYTFEFDDGTEGWEGDFADYPAGEEVAYELNFDYEMLPVPLDQYEGALVLSGTNMSDDLFMYAKRRIADLSPNTTYSVQFSIQFASDVPDKQVGVGGSPGESVWIKAGATTIEPEVEMDDMNYYRMNIDKGGQSQGGSDMVVLGDFSNDTDEEVYTLKTVSNDEPLMVTTNNEGECWVIVGTDSGFESTTTIYYNAINIIFDEP